MAAVALVGCTPDRPGSPGSPAPGTPSLTPAPTSAPDAEGGDDGAGRVRTTAPEPTADRDRTAAAVLAAKVMRLYARPDVDAGRWLRDLAPYFSVTAQQDYQGTDPATIPARQVTGRPGVVATDSTRLARVHVPTDAGMYLVVLSRSPADPTWRVERIRPPEEVGI
jgi:hypothetical protein